MKYLLCFFLFLVGCQSSSGKLERWMESNGKVKVLSTTAIIDDLVGQIGGQWIDHIALIEGAMDPHSYELVKGDSEKLSYAHVIFYNGLGLEHGGNIRQQLVSHPKSISLGDKIRDKNPDLILFERGQVDPHIWLDIILWSGSIDPIVKALSETDPSHAADYFNNGLKAKETLKRLDASLIEKIQQIAPEKRYLVTSHDAFNYFTRRYLQDEANWKDRFCAPEGLAPDGQLSCSDIQKVIDHLIQHHIRVIFPESNVSLDSLKKIVSVCHEKGIEVKIAKESLYSDSLGPSDYQQMMQHNVDVLCEAWK